MSKENEVSIDRFAGHYRFLSNFYPCKVKWEGETYPSTEHAFQAAKTVNPSERKRIRTADTPGKAKALGRRATLVPNWEAVKLDVMLKLLRQKFGHRELADLLLDTDGLRLVEGNTWNDRFWGVVDGKGHNHLGRLLMQVRDELRQKTAKNVKR